jgi:HK97 family phage major capsid protein
MSEAKNEGVADAPAGDVAVDDLSGLQQVIGDFVCEIKSFKGDITSELQQQKARLTMIDRKNCLQGRPSLSTAATVEAPHQKAFETYVRSGDEDALRGLDLAGKAMSTAVAADGGYLVDPQTAETCARCCARPRRCARWPMW